MSTADDSRERCRCETVILHLEVVSQMVEGTAAARHGQVPSDIRVQIHFRAAQAVTVSGPIEPRL